MMGGADLAYEGMGNVVSVMIQYRLGMFGKYSLGEDVNLANFFGQASWQVMKSRPMAH